MTHVNDPEHIKNNAVGRVHTVLNRALKNRANDNSTITAEMWANIFNVTESELSFRYAAVAEKLVTLIHQLEKGANILAANGANPSTYTAQFTAAREFLSPVALSSPWNEHWTKINSEIVTALALCADRLPEDSSPLATEEFVEALATLDQLDDQVQQGDFDEALKSFVIAEIDILRAGIRDYPTLGLAAIENALEKAVGKMVITRVNGQVEMRDESVTEISKILGTFGRWVIVHAPHVKLLSEMVHKLLDDGS